MAFVNFVEKKRYKNSRGVTGRRLRARRGGDGRLALDPSTTSLRLFAQDDTLMAQNDARARLQSGGGFPLLNKNQAGLLI